MRDGSDDTPRWMVWALALIIVVLLTPQFALGLFAPDTGQVAFMQDDSFYYAEIARRFSETGWITFDGINPTNGFHPLYFLMVSALAKVLPDDLFLNGIYTLHVLLVGVGAWIFSMQLRGLSIWGRIILLAVFLHPKILTTLWVNAGMEASLAFAAAAWTMERFHRALSRAFRDHRANILFGTASAILMLARLDSVLIVGPLALWAAFFVLREREDQTILRLLSLFLIPVVCCGAYLGLNLWFTGHLTPVSSAAKRSFNFPRWVTPYTITYGWNPRHIVLAAAPVVVALTGIAVGLLRRKTDPVLGASLVHGGLGVAVFAVYLFGFAPNAFNWYLASIMGVAAWVAGRLIALYRFRKGPSGWRRKVMPVLAIILAVYSVDDQHDSLEYAWGPDPSQIPGTDLMMLGLELSELTETGDIAGMYDAGKVGYFAVIPVVNLDGLVNSYEYLEEVKKPGRYLEYFEEIGLTHLILRTTQLTGVDDVRSGDYASAAFIEDKRIIFAKEDELMRKSVAEGFTVVVFRYPPAHDVTPPGN